MQLTATLSYLLYAASIAAAIPVEKRAYTSGTTANDVKDGICRDITFIFARGSTEVGNLGESVGPSVAKKLGSKAAIQGVDYTASIASNAELGAGGGPVMNQLITQAKQKCPNTKIFVGGYSQGGEVVHYASKHGGNFAQDVAGAVLYGDPELKLGSITGLQKSQIKEFCASGDGVCETGTFAITAAHLSYTTNGDTTQGANFILQQAGSGGASSGGSDSSDSGSDSSSGSSSGGLSGLLGGGLGGLGGLGSSSASDSGDASGTSSASAGDATSSGAASSGGFGSLFGGGSGSKLGGLFGGI